MTSQSAELKVGVISDTHGLLRPEAFHALEGSDLILHAGDIGKPEIIQELRRIAPVVGVRGNVDVGSDWINEFPEINVTEIAGHHLYMLHDLKQLDLNPAAAGFSAVVSGHSHKPKYFVESGVLFLNPGSAGPRRFRLPVTVARILISDGKLVPELIEIPV